MIFPEIVSGFAGGIFANGITAGGLAAIFMTLIVGVPGPRPVRMETGLSVSQLSEIREFLNRFASRNGWDTAMANRLDAVAEETLLTLLRPEDESGTPRRLRLSALKEESGAVLEFIVSPRGENVQERMAVLGAPGDDASVEQEVSLRLLRHLASSVRHQQYHDLDIVTVQVAAPGTGS